MGAHKILISIFLLSLFACHGPKGSETLESVGSISVRENKSSSIRHESCWEGLLGGKIPVFIHFNNVEDIVTGEIVYLNTKDKYGIRITGTVDKEQRCSILEFNPFGTITGIIEGVIEEYQIIGSWTSPITKRTLSLDLNPKDTFVELSVLVPVMDDIFGEYHYEYGENDFMGDFTINELDSEKVEFRIFTSTGLDSGPNIAEIENDTIQLIGTSFMYSIPESDNCQFIVRFFRGFLHIKYLADDCDGQFGLGATLEGIYLKI